MSRGVAIGKAESWRRTDHPDNNLNGSNHVLYLSVNAFIRLHNRSGFWAPNRGWAVTHARRISGDVVRPAPVTILVDGRTVLGVPGESLAATLLAAGLARFRNSPRAGTPRGPFCFMGICQECLVRVDGHLVPACQESVREGMCVELGCNG
jgi:hypothetical protein